MSPTARTLVRLRASGYLADVCERFIAAVQRRRDLFGFADVLAIRRGEKGVLAVQATTRGHVQDRLTKAKSRRELAVWLGAGNSFEVWGWHKREDHWRVHRVAVNGGDLRESVWTPRGRLRPAKQKEFF
jgi:hypothetical protein